MLLITSLYLVLRFVIKSHADEVKLYPTADAYVDKQYPDINFGSSDTLYCLADHEIYYEYMALMLIRFNISSIPKGSVVNEAYFYLYI
ncbi:MAG: CBM96 family carbohydrate-binding protein [bacterium]